jgi:hypothetical protein
MNKTQIFTLLVIGGLIILATVSYFLLQEVRATMREKANYEAMSHGLREVKGLLGQFRQPQD